jgi:hypothetical protein
MTEVRWRHKAAGVDVADVPVVRSSRTRRGCRGAAVVGFPPEPTIQLPSFGEVYKVRGYIQIPTDKKWDRPAVVVGIPQDLDGRIRIVTRTSDLGRKGVPSPEDHTLEFDLPGVWGYYRSVEARLWEPPNVRHLGVLDSSIVKEICRFFGIRGTVS